MTEMRNLAGERGQPQPQKDPQHFGRRSGVLRADRVSTGLGQICLVHQALGGGGGGNCARSAKPSVCSIWAISLTASSKPSLPKVWRSVSSNLSPISLPLREG